MKTISRIISFPITVIISALCFLCVLTFESDFKEKGGVSAFTRIWIESKNLSLIEAWTYHPIASAIISIAIYYAILS